MRSAPALRRATPEDAERCHDVMWASVTDFGARHGTPLPGTAAEWWAAGHSVQSFLADHSAEWWVAEASDGDSLVGYARSVERGGLLELTEFFVLPTHQSAGVGRALIERAFPNDRGDVRSIIATTDVRALRRYYAAGTVARFPMLTLEGTPGEAAEGGRLSPEELDADSPSHLGAVEEIERSVLEFARPPGDVRWLLQEREGHVYRRGRDVVGFAFVGKGGTGPIAAVDPTDLPAILLHVEYRARVLGLERIDLQVPAPNEIATRHLLSRGFRLDPWVNLLMSNRPFGRFDRVVTFGPPLFL